MSDNSTTENFGVTLVKAASLNFAAIVGMFGGLAVVGSVIDRHKKSKKSKTEVHLVK